SGGVGQGPSLCNDIRHSASTTAIGKARPVGLILDGRDLFSLDYGKVRRPHTWLVWRPRTSRRNQGSELGQELGYYEHLRKDGVRPVGRRCSKDQLGVGRKLD